MAAHSQHMMEMMSSTMSSAMTHVMGAGGAGGGADDPHAHHTTTEMDHSMHHPPDHSAHGDGHMMMYFHGGYMETILFEFWKIDSVLGLVLSMVGLFLVGALYEGLKVFREYLLLRSRSHQLKLYASVQGGGEHKLHGNGTTGPPASPTHLTESGGGGDPAAVHINEGSSSPLGAGGESTHARLLSSSHLLQTALHMFQVLVSYLLMLVFMTYNTWLCLAVVLGAGVGYFAFGWKKAVVGDTNEHCN